MELKSQPRFVGSYHLVSQCLLKETKTKRKYHHILNVRVRRNKLVG